MKIKAKIFFLLLATTLTTLSIGVSLLFITAKDSLQKESFNKLTAVREMKATQIEDYFQQIENQLLTLAEDRMTIDAMRAFQASFKTLDRELKIADLEQQGVNPRLQKYYSDVFVPKFFQKSGVRDTALLTRINQELNHSPDSRNSRILQDLYIASNPYHTGLKHRLDTAGDRSRYTQAHALYHPILRNYLERFGYYDIFLVDIDTGHIVYTVFKEVDYGTSLLSGPFRQTNLAEAFQSVRSSPDKNFFKLVDFKPYTPSYGAPAAFIAAPIYDGNQRIGVLVFQLPIDRIQEVMTNHQGWAKVGLGKTGETYLVGSDLLLRNQSRFWIEDRENYLQAIAKMGLSPRTIHQIRNLNTTIGLQPVKTQGTEAALRGETGTAIFPDYRGISVLSSYRPLQIHQLNWAILSEIDAAEAFAYIRALQDTTAVGAAILIGVAIAASHFFSRTLTQALQELTNRVKEISQHDFRESSQLQLSEHLAELAHRQQDEIGDLARSFQRMETDLEQSIETLRRTTAAKERMESELKIGRDIQMSMLKLTFPAFPDRKDLDLYAVLQPAREVAGDFFDFYFLHDDRSPLPEENRFCFCLGDVSGKGVPAALFMAVTKTLLKSEANKRFSPAEILTQVNQKISADNPACMFVTVFFGILDLSNGELVYTNAGHNPPYIRRNNGELEELNQRHGLALGMMEHRAYQESRTTLAVGDILVVFTDGVVEAMDRSQTLFSKQRLEALLKSSQYQWAEDAIGVTLEAVKGFQKEAEQADDLTMLSLQFLGPTMEIRNISVLNQS
jgi:serine phosphatase RsbU (regulator of sigma subunit)